MLRVYRPLHSLSYSPNDQSTHRRCMLVALGSSLPRLWTTCMGFSASSEALRDLEVTKGDGHHDYCGDVRYWRRAWPRRAVMRQPSPGRCHSTEGVSQGCGQERFQLSSWHARAYGPCLRVFDTDAAVGARSRRRSKEQRSSSSC